MPVGFYIDVNVDSGIAHELRRRDVDVLTVIEDGRRRLPDDQVLTRAMELGRVVFTGDIGFRAMAIDWIRTGRPFAGLIFGHQLSPLRLLIDNLELIAKASDVEEWRDRVEYLPW